LEPTRATAASRRLPRDLCPSRARTVDPQTGEHVDVELFVAVLGASNYTYAEAMATNVGDFVAAHVRGLPILAKVPEIVVPDQLKSAVVVALRSSTARCGSFAPGATAVCSMPCARHRTAGAA
jgi:transposase